MTQCATTEIEGGEKEGLKKGWRRKKERNQQSKNMLVSFIINRRFFRISECVHLTSVSLNTYTLNNTTKRRKPTKKEGNINNQIHTTNAWAVQKTIQASEGCLGSTEGCLGSIVDDFRLLIFRSNLSKKQTFYIL